MNKIHIANVILSQYHHLLQHDEVIKLRAGLFSLKRTLTGFDLAF